MILPHLSLEHLSKLYGANKALEAVDLAVDRGELLTLLGPSGCGKTTVLRLVAGFIEPSSGRILIDGNDVTHVSANARGIGMVFQNYALFPHLSVARNIAFGLVERGVPRAQIRTRVAELLELIRLTDAADRYPAELSGGQQQRVALARAVAYAPQLLLMDEPLSALDVKLREAMQLEIRRIQKELGITTVYVTHDQTEAMRISDRIAIMNAGRIEQIGTGSDIYATPASTFVADFLGKINLWPARLASIDASHMNVSLPFGELRVPRRDGFAAGSTVTLGIRPHEIALDAVADGDTIVVSGTMLDCSFLGDVWEYRVRLPDGSLALVDAKPATAQCRPGQQITLGWRGSACKVFAQ